MNRFLLGTCVALCAGILVSAQENPASSMGCFVGADGIMACSGLQNPPGVRPTIAGPRIGVRTYVLAPGAPLDIPSTGNDLILVVMTDGDLLNEAKKQDSKKVYSGQVMSLPANVHYSFKNAGQAAMKVLVISAKATATTE